MARAPLSDSHKAAISAGVSARYRAKHVERGTDGKPTPIELKASKLGIYTPLVIQ
jgi:hypothetical protein